MKIAVCTPVHGSPRAEFTAHLAKMLITSVKARPDDEFEIFMSGNARIAKARNRIAEMALAWGADWLLWIDSDHTFPRDTALTLLGHGVPIIGANYPRRNDLTGPTAETVIDGSWHPVWTTPEAVNAQPVQQVGRIGMGLALIRADVFAAVAQPWFPSSDDESEDYGFFRKVRAAKIPIFIDHRLSWNVGHVHETVITHAHTIADRDRYLLSRKPPTT